MFVSSPYSPFFNSGLLARDDTPRSRARRSSLPSQSSSSHKSTCAYYRSLQRRGHDEHRSFLSLDLAESRLSERHGPQAASRNCSWLIPPVPALPPLPAVSPLRSHFSSTSSLPKPAMLPDPPPPPYSIRHAPRLPELPVLPALDLLPPRPQRPLPAPPPRPSSPPRSSVLTKPRHLRSKKPKNLAIVTTPHPNRLSKASVSTASTRVRRRNRWDALDALEGRRKPTDTTTLFVPPVKKKNTNLENVFVNPATFAPRPKRTLPTFMNMTDDSDPEPNDSSDSYSSDDPDPRLTLNARLFMNQNVPLDIDPLHEPEDIVLPPIRPRPPSAEFNTSSYLDVEAEEEEEEEEGVVLEATRCPAPSSPPPPTIQRTWVSRVKGPVERPTTKDKSRSSKLPHHHHNHHPSTSSSRRHKPSPSTSTTMATPPARPRNNHSHYKSFIELDMDDLLEPSSSSNTATVSKHPRESGVGMFEWRGRVGRGMAEGGGEWVWV